MVDRTDRMPPRKSSGGPIRNAERTRARILEKATRLFARKGFDGTSTAEIVAAARINKRMLFYYFGDKKGLYREIFVAEWGSLKEEMDRAIAEQIASGLITTSREGLVAVLGVLYDFMASHHDLLRLMMWEGLEGGAISRSIWKEVRGPLFHQAVTLIEQAKADGYLDPGLDPAQFIVTWLGAVTFYFAYAHTMTDMIGPHPHTAKAVLHRRAQLVAMQERLFRTHPSPG